MIVAKMTTKENINPPLKSVLTCEKRERDVTVGCSRFFFYNLKTVLVLCEID